MLDYTKAAILKTVSDIKNIAFISRLLFYIAGIAIPVYNILFSRGLLILHIVSLCLSVSVLVLYLVYRDTDDKKEKKKLKVKRKQVKKARKKVNFVCRAYTILCTGYAVFVLGEEFSAISLLITLFAILALFISIIFELVKWVIMKRANMIYSAIREDLSPLNPVKGIGNIIKKMKGESVEKDLYLSDSDRKILNDYIDEQYSTK